MILEEITLGKDNDSKRKAIQDNLGQQVILNDFHQNWAHGVLLKEGYDNEVYRIKIADGKGQRQLHYNDLNQLLVIRNYPKHKRPKID